MSSENLFGKLTNAKYPNKEPKFLVEVRAYRDLEGSFCIDDSVLPVTDVHAYAITNWNDSNEDEEPGGPGLCIYTNFETRSGKPYSVQVVIPKDELIKALAELVE